MAAGGVYGGGGGALGGERETVQGAADALAGAAADGSDGVHGGFLLGLVFMAGPFGRLVLAAESRGDEFGAGAVLCAGEQVEVVEIQRKAGFERVRVLAEAVERVDDVPEVIS